MSEERKKPSLFDRIKTGTGMIVDIIVIVGAIQTVIRYVVFH